MKRVGGTHNHILFTGLLLHFQWVLVTDGLLAAPGLHIQRGVTSTVDNKPPFHLLPFYIDSR